MINKMEQYAKGEFDYELPTIVLSKDKIEIAVQAGKMYSSTFSITNQEEARMKGVLYSSSRRFHIEEKQFVGNDAVIHYSYDASKMAIGEKEAGYIEIISDGGELSLPFEVIIEAPVCNTTIGPIRNMFQFTDLCKSDWSEALKLFKSPEFETVLLATEPEAYRCMYRNLMKGRSQSGALEEFLIAIHKKEKVQLSISSQSFAYKIKSKQFRNCTDQSINEDNETFQDKIILTKDHWGYAEIRVNTNADFIQLDHKILWTDNFVGNQYSLEFVLLPALLSRGKNYGKIYVETITQSFTIDVECELEHIDSQEKINRRKLNSYRNKLTQTYLAFRCKNIELSQYIFDTTQLLHSIQLISKEERYRLLELHLLMISGEEIEVKQQLDLYEEKINELLEQHPLTYCSILYLKSLLYKDEATIQMCCDKIRFVYESGNQEYLILWFLLNLDKRYIGNREYALNDMKKQYQAHVNSPVLYFEAMSLFNQEPALLHNLGAYEIHVLNFGIKYSMVTEDVANQYAYLATKERYFNRLIYLGLVRLYERYQTKDLLVAICSLLIKGHMRSAKYFKWFKLGVKSQLRVTELHEYFMYTIDEHSEEELPQPILLYFIYNSSLNDKKRAYLYARIVRDKERNGSIYRTYAKKIEQFTRKQLEHHNMNENLAILYNDLAQEEAISKEECYKLAQVAYRYEVVCNNPNMKGVYVDYEELEREEYIPFVDGRAQVNLVLEDVGLYLVDSKDQRYVVSIDYTMKRLMPESKKIRKLIGDTNVNDYHRMETLMKESNYHTFDDEFVNVCNRMCVSSEVKKSHRNKIIEQMIYYCNEHRSFEMLDYYLSLVDLSMLTKVGRSKVIDIMISREDYLNVIPLIKDYGYEDLSIGKLLKFCQRLIAGEEENFESEYITKMCHYLFLCGRRDEEIVRYLASHYIGASNEMYRIWQCAKKDNIPTYLLEEQLLAQTLFAHSMLEHQAEVFLSFYEYSPKHTICKAYLNYFAYRTIMFDEVLKYEILQCMKTLVDKSSNCLCSLAILKNYTYHLEDVMEEEKNFIREQFDVVLQNGYMLSCLKQLGQVVTLPKEIMEKQYVEYRANPCNQVKLHYRIRKNSTPTQEFMVEAMSPMLLGVYIRSFILFYDEELEYYFTQEVNGQVESSEPGCIAFVEANMGDSVHTDYAHINRMLKLFEAKNSEQLAVEMDEYIKQEYLIHQYFKSI